MEQSINAIDYTEYAYRENVFYQISCLTNHWGSENHGGYKCYETMANKQLIESHENIFINKLPRSLTQLVSHKANFAN